MKQTIRFQSLIIPKKLRLEIRISVDERGAEYQSTSPDGNKNVGIQFLPITTLTIMRPREIDEYGSKTNTWNPNDSLGLTKYTLGIFVDELEGIKNDMKIKELYTYTGKRLELNEEIAAKIRRPFVVGNTTVELSAVVITQPDDSRVEGIKMKFNNEQSSVLLTLNELTSLLYSLKTLNVDTVSLLMYLKYINEPGRPTNFNNSSLPEVDIKPKTTEFD